MKIYYTAKDGKCKTPCAACPGSYVGSYICFMCERYISHGRDEKGRYVECKKDE